MNTVYNLAFLLLFQLLFVADRPSEIPGTSSVPACQQQQKSNNDKTANIVFRSSDGGQTWQDISEGLPKPLQDDYSAEAKAENNFGRDEFFANDNGIYLTAGNGIYHSKQNAKAPFWNKVNGKTWKQVYNGGGVNMVESNGVQVATNGKGIIRSIDGGENWELVISEGGVGIDVERIKGGFAAITYSSASNSRRVRTSYDGGKTWQPIDAGLPASLSIASMIEVGENFFCGHPEGIFKSSNKGKTWELLLPSVDNKVFNLSVSGNVIYAIPRSGGC
jgi:photosystem II stability/assembly factor-like uncharacterized protein